MGGPSSRLVPSNAIVLRYLLDFFRSTFPGGCNVVSLDDVALAHVLLAENGAPGERYLIGSENLSWRTLHSLIADLAGVAGPRIEVPTAAAYITSAAAEAWASSMTLIYDAPPYETMVGWAGEGSVAHIYVRK